MRFSTVGIGLLLVSCGTVQNSPDASPACTPGASMACVANGCSGAQICNASGSGYGSCECNSMFDASDDALDAMDELIADASDAGPFSPSKLSGLVLWLDGSKGVTVANGLVAKWADQSPNNNNAIPPIANESCIPLASAVNGHDAVRCPAQQFLAINDSQTLQFGTGPFAQPSPRAS